jgi:flagellar hook-associated protein 3 FlgL
MSIRPFVAGNYAATSNAGRLISQRSVMDELQRQLATLQRSENYAGLGVERVTSLEIRQKLAITEGYQSTITDVGQRLKFADLSLNRISGISEEFASLIGPTSFSTSLNGQPIAVQSARLKLDEMLDMLNTNYAGRYLFSGRASDTAPVLGSKSIIEGDSTGDGLRTLITERRTADTGTGTGRTVISGVGTTATFAEEAPAQPFGLKFDTTLPATTRSTLSNATITGPVGVPASLSVNFTGQPANGEKLVFQLRLPDGSTKEVALSASINAPAAATADQFQIGATPAATAANLRTAIDLAARRETDSTLRGVSALEVSKDFFAQRPRANGNYYPQRILAPVTGASTGFAADGARPTVAFYQGEDTPNPAIPAVPTDTLTIRGQVAARIEPGVSVAVGVRANEEAFGDILASLAVFTVEDFTLPPNPTADQKLVVRDRFEALASSARGLITGSDGGQTVRTLQTEFGLVAANVQGARERQAQRANIFKTVLNDIEGVNKEEVAAKVLTVQTNLQASYQITAIMSRLSLVEYLR